MTKEDRKIRKELLELIGCMHDADPRKERWLAWLEKQGNVNALIQEAAEKSYTEGMRVERKRWLEKQGEQNLASSAKIGMDEESKWTEEDEQYLLVCKNALHKYQWSDKWDADIISKWLEDKLKQRMEE